MLIGIDESGSFAQSATKGSWCVVAAYAFAERRKTANLRALIGLKKKYGRSLLHEIKLGEIDEVDYFQFLKDLAMAGGTLFSVATDGALADENGVKIHQASQVEKILVNIPNMKYEEGRRAVSILAEDLGALSAQLYVQLCCQVVLLTEVIRQSILFFAQRDPLTLRRFVWRIDQKTAEKGKFEKSFERIAPGLIQAVSLREPFIFLEGANYHHFRAYELPADKYPVYLQEQCGLEPRATVNVGKLIREDMAFPDSKHDQMVQIADLLASGLRRVLRGGFTDNRTAARLLGRLTVQSVRKEPPISLVHLSESERLPLDKVSLDAVELMREVSQPMLG
jgi:hypothetical protein